MKKQSPHSTPSWANKILEKCIKLHLWEEFLGDLEELHQERLEYMSETKAKLWYWADTLSLVYKFFHFKFSLFNSPNIMLANHLKMAFRQFRKDTFYSAFNLIGLSIGFTTFIFLFLYTQNELSYDQFHKRADHTFRVACDLETPSQTFNFALTPPWVGPAIADNFPTVESFVRLMRGQSLMTYEDRSFQEDNIYWAETDFFNLFSYPLIEGNIHALKEPYSLVITQAIAHKYFGEENPIGKTMTFGGDEQGYTIRGIVENPPSNSHLDFDILVSFASILADRPDMESNWFYFDYYTYILLKPDASSLALSEQLPEMVSTVAGQAQEDANQYYHFSLQPISSIHLNSNLDGEISTPGNANYVWIFIGVAILTLLIGCINFINLATARAFKRAREVGIRKTVGALKGQLIAQFLTESYLITFLSFGLALILAQIFMPMFNDLANKELTLDILFTPSYFLQLLLLILLVGLLSGAFPAFILANFKPISVLKTSFQPRSHQSLARKTLIVFQLSFSVLLICCTWIIHQQWQKMQVQDLGFQQDQMLVVDLKFDNLSIQNAQLLKTSFAQHPDVEKVSLVRTTPDMFPSNWYASYESESGEMQNSSLNGYLVDHDFLLTYDIPLIAGRDFSVGLTSDSMEAFIINESAVKFLGWNSPEQALDKRFNQFGKEGKIIGVIKDFHIESLHHEIAPLAIQLEARYSSRLSLKVSTANYSQLISNLQDTWSSIITHRSMDYYFLDEGLEQKYQAEKRAETLFRYFSFLALIISGLGLVGFSSFMAERQKKEVSIRKILGAQVSSLALRYTFSFVSFGLIACLISFPIIFWGMETWLQSFPYRISFPFSTMILSGILVVLFCGLIVSYHAIRTARTEPSKYLRQE